MPSISIDGDDAEYIVRVLQKVRHPDEMTLHWRAEVDWAARFIDRLLNGASEPEFDMGEHAHATATELEDWAGWAADRIAGPEGLQHSVAPSGGTACGLPAEAIVVYRHLFAPERLDACEECRGAIRADGGKA